MSQDGRRRSIVAQGRYLSQPLSIDVFESNMFWVSGNGQVMKQDKLLHWSQLQRDFLEIEIAKFLLCLMTLERNFLYSSSYL